MELKDTIARVARLVLEREREAGLAEQRVRQACVQRTFLYLCCVHRSASVPKALVCRWWCFSHRLIARSFARGEIAGAI